MRNRNMIVLAGLLMMFISCGIPINGQTDIQKKKLEKSVSAAGYKIKVRKEVEPTDWEKEQFDLQSKYRIEVKSVKPIPGKREKYYYRYAVEIEVYKNEEDAGERLGRLKELPPGADDMMNPEYVLRDGFRRGNLVYIISTDVAMFSYTGLSDLKKNLEKAIPAED